ncbi:MAG: UDP-N-acetylmuramoyl-L-alanyl-D-glutamate--2,6-diaminopimelate ligase [Moraxellaceae bacterium]
MKTLRALWSAVDAVHAETRVTAIVTDSRAVRPGMLFAAVKGSERDGRDFIPAAIAAGASAVMADRDARLPASTVMDGVPVIAVQDLAAALGPIAARFHDEPSRQMRVLAVTGTNGKTSVANLLAACLNQLGEKTAVLGTLGNGFPGELEKSTHTTVEACTLQGLLAGYRNAGARAVAMEASSHGLVQGRLNGTQIDIALFTNLTRDHLDYHGDMERYAAAKELLFRWPGLNAAVLNADDPVSARYAAVLPADTRCLRYSQQGAADISVLRVALTMQGLSLAISLPDGDIDVDVPLLGRFNVSNVLAVAGGLHAFGVPAADIARALRGVRPVPGRMESLVGEHPTVVVDYAHTPDALEKVLQSLREHAKGRLVCVFGCGGDRDRGKRAEMGAIAARLADDVIITSDNPRSESAAAIADDIREGAGEKASVLLDRRQAIHRGIAAASRHDIVLVAGKGHEDYQEVAGVRHPFSDIQEVRVAVAQWGKA